MEVIILPDAAQLAEVAAALIADVVRNELTAVLGLATGSSPLEIYARLAEFVHAGELDLSGVGAFALDEYVGIPAEHPESYVSVIRREVTEPLGLDASRVHVPDGRASDIGRACDEYEAAIAAAGGVDLQLLGIGSNGHVGFNEPSSSLSSRTRIKTLTRRTRVDNARFFASPDQVPTHCITQGLGTIMDARRLLLVAQGEHKAAAIAAAVEGPVTAMCPASILQFHRHATVVVDEAAASALAHAEYYRHSYENKPARQHP